MQIAIISSKYRILRSRAQSQDGGGRRGEHQGGGQGPGPHREGEGPTKGESSQRILQKLLNVFIQAFGVMDATDIVQKSSQKTWTFDRVYNAVEENR